MVLPENEKSFKMKVQFKTKYNAPFIKFPNSFKRHHIIRENGDRSRLERYYNSDLFERMLQITLNKELRVPLGMSACVGELPDFITVKEGFMAIVTIDLGKE